MPFDLSDRRIAVAVRNWEELKAFGFDGPICYCKVIERDSNGVWVENVDWPLKPVSGKDAEEYAAIHFLIPWHNITAIGLFPREKPMARSGRIVSILSQSAL